MGYRNKRKRKGTFAIRTRTSLCSDRILIFWPVKHISMDSHLAASNPVGVVLQPDK